MNKLFLVPLLGFLLTSVPGSAQISVTQPSTQVQQNNATSDEYHKATDHVITDKIQKELEKDKTLSQEARNLNIVTINGVVSVKGSVKNVNERVAVIQKIKTIQGVVRVDDHIDIKK